MAEVDKVQDAYKLYLEGYSYNYIGMKLKCSRATAYNLVSEAQILVKQEQIQDLNILRNTELERLDTLIKLTFEDLIQAFDVSDDSGRLYRDGIKSRSQLRQEVLKYVQERAKLLGLYAPERVEKFVTTENTTNDASKVDYQSLSLDELQSLFNDHLRE